MMAGMWLRALAGLLACVFAMPSCMTMMLWQADRGVQGDRSNALTDTAGFVRAGDGGPLLAVDTRDCGAIVDALRPAGEPARRWLLITPTAHAETLAKVEAMFAGQQAPFITHLQRSLSDDGTPQQDRVGFWLQSYQLGGLPDGIWDLQERHKYRGLYGNSYEILVPCRLDFVDAPPGPPVAWPNGRIWCDIGKPVVTPTGERLWRTPLCVLGDLVLLPFEMLTIFSWW